MHVFQDAGQDRSSYERLDVMRLSIDEAIANPLLGYAYIEPVTGIYPHNLLVESALALRHWRHCADAVDASIASLELTEDHQARRMADAISGRRHVRECMDIRLALGFGIVFHAGVACAGSSCIFDPVGRG